MGDSFLLICLQLAKGVSVAGGWTLATLASSHQVSGREVFVDSIMYSFIQQIYQQTLRCAFFQALAKMFSVHSCVQLFASPGLQSTRLLCPWNFPGQEYWNRLPFPPPGDLPDPGIKPTSLASPALAGGFFTAAPSGKPGKNVAMY